MLAIIAALLAVIFAPTLLILLARLVSESPRVPLMRSWRCRTCP